MAIRGMSRLPFVEWIEEEIKPKDFTPPIFDKFNGKTDPISHLMHVCQKISLETSNDVLMCKLFVTTLVGSALAWFIQLPTGSLDSFEDLGRKFME